MQFIKSNFNKSISFVKNNFKLILIIIFIGLLFYWYEWRPSNIRKECTKIALDKVIERKNKSTYKELSYDSAKKIRDFHYTECIHSRGI